MHLRTHAGQCDPAGPEKCQMRLIQKQLLWHLSASLLYYTLILYNETDEWTVTTSGVCIFTHFEEIMWGCIKMYCRWKGIFSKSHEHVTELLFFFFTWAQWTMFWTEVPAGQCVVYTGVLVWKIETNTLRNIPKSTEIKEHNLINA